MTSHAMQDPWSSIDEHPLTRPDLQTHQSKRKRVDASDFQVPVDISTDFIENFTESGPSSDSEDCCGLPLLQTGLHSWSPTQQLKIPDAIEAIARRGRALFYDPVSNTYRVLNGDLLQKEFNELRAVRRKKNVAAKDRPFSRMHAFYVLLQGEKWARTGSVFAPKDVAAPGSPAASDSGHSPSPSEHSTSHTPPSVELGDSEQSSRWLERVSVSVTDEGGRVHSVPVQTLLSALLQQLNPDLLTYRPQPQQPSHSHPEVDTGVCCDCKRRRTR